MRKKVRINTGRKDKRVEILIVALLLTVISLFRAPHLIQALANEDGTSSSELEANEETTIDNIKKVIQEKKEELGTLRQNQRNKQAYLAKITRVSEETLTVENHAGSKIIPLEEGLEISKEIEKIEIDDWVGVYGMIEEDNFNPKKIVVYKEDFTPKTKKIMLASISEIYPNNLTVTDRSGENKSTFILDKNTQYQDYQGNDASYYDLYKDLQLLIVAFENKSGDYVVSTLRALTVFE